MINRIEVLETILAEKQDVIKSADSAKLDFDMQMQQLISMQTDNERKKQSTLTEIDVLQRLLLEYDEDRVDESADQVLEGLAAELDSEESPTPDPEDDDNVYPDAGPVKEDDTEV